MGGTGYSRDAPGGPPYGGPTDYSPPNHSKF